MSQQTIGVGASANDGTGDPLRTAFTKTNANFTELYGYFSAYGITLTQAANASAARTVLGLAIGTNVQAYSANLDEYAAVNPTSAGLALLDDADASAQLTTLGFSTFVKTLVDEVDAAAFRAAIGAGTGTGSGDLLAANNLSDVANAGTARTNLGLAIGTNVQAYDAELAAIAGLTSAADKVPYFTGSGTAAVADFTSYGRTLVAAADQTVLKPTESLIIACGDETTAITTGTAKVTFRMPYAFTLTAVRASVTTAPTGSTIIIDINEAGSTILSTNLSIDASEKTSTTAASAAVISDASLADDAEMTIDFDQVGSTIAGAGVKVTLIGHRT